MRKILCFISALILIIISLSACETVNDSETPSSGNTDETEIHVSTSEMESEHETEFSSEHISYELETEDYSNIPDGFTPIYSCSIDSISVWKRRPDDHAATTLYIKKWDEYFSFPYDCRNNHSLSGPILSSADIFGENGVYLIPDDQFVSKFIIYAFTKGNKNVTESELSLPESLWLHDLFFSFTDDGIGFLFVFEEGNLDKYNADAAALAYLYKTQDDGRSWALVECNDIPYVQRNEYPIYAEFLNENIGVFCGRELFEDIEDRSFITFDGGKTWEHFSKIPCPEGKYASAIKDINYSNGIYTMYVQTRYRDGEKGDYTWKIYTYKSSDMKSWKLQQ